MDAMREEERAGPAPRAHQADRGSSSSCSPARGQLRSAGAAVAAGRRGISSSAASASRTASNSGRNIEPGGKCPGVQRQGLQDLRREQAVRPQFPQHAGEQRGGLAHQGLVRRIVLRDVVAGRRRAVRALDQETEKRLLFGGEEHGQRGPAARGDPVLAAAGRRGRRPPAPVARSRPAAPGLAQAISLAVPDEPLLAGRPRPVDRVT